MGSNLFVRKRKLIESIFVAVLIILSIATGIEFYKYRQWSEALKNSINTPDDHVGFNSFINGLENEMVKSSKQNYFNTNVRPLLIVLIVISILFVTYIVYVRHFINSNKKKTTSTKINIFFMLILLILPFYGCGSSNIQLSNKGTMDNPYLMGETINYTTYSKYDYFKVDEDSKINVEIVFHDNFSYDRSAYKMNDEYYSLVYIPFDVKVTLANDSKSTTKIDSISMRVINSDMETDGISEYSSGPILDSGLEQVYDMYTNKTYHWYYQFYYPESRTEKPKYMELDIMTKDHERQHLYVDLSTNN